MIYKILRYLAQALAIYLIFRFMPELTTGDPNARLNNSDILMITLVIMLIYILFENLCNLYSDEKPNTIIPSNMTAQEKNNLCNSVCSINKEHMTSVTYNQPVNSLPINNQPVNTLPINNQPVNTLPIYNQPVSTLPINNQPVNTLPINNQPIHILPIDNQPISILPINNKPCTQPINNQPINILPINDEDSNYPPYPDNNHCNPNTLNNTQKLLMEEFLIYLQNKRKKPNSENSINCQMPNDGTRQNDGLVDNDMPYNDYNHIPVPNTMAVGYDSRDYEYGYSFLPPSQWYPQPPFPPVCVSEKQCPVCPVFTTGTPVDVKEWDDSRKIMPPDRFNINYAKKLNGGR